MLSRRSIAHLGFILLTLAASGCGRPVPPPSLLVLTIAGWPAADASAPPTPALDGIAGAAARTAAMITSSDLTASEASVQTGLGPTRHGLRGQHDGELLAAGVPTLATAAAAAGATTAAFVASPGLLPRLDRGFGKTGGAKIARRRPAGAVVDEALSFLAALPAEQRFYLWVQLDAGDDLGGADGLTEVDAAVGRLLTAIVERGAGTVIAAVGTVGAVREVALLGDTAILVGRVVNGPAGGSLECGTATNAVAAEVARRAGLTGIACEPIAATDAIATARRFGLLVAAGGTEQPIPLANPPTDDLVSDLTRLGLPAPLTERQLARTGVAPLAEFRQPVLDQELARIRLHAGHTASAKALYERALVADPLALEALVETAQLAASTGDIAGPEGRLTAALPSYRGRPEIYHALAHTAFLRGDHDRALVCARVAGLFSPDDLDLAFDAAVNLAALGRRAEALRSLDRAVALGLSDLRLLKLDAFRSLHDEPGFHRIVQQLRPGA